MGVKSQTRAEYELFMRRYRKKWRSPYRPSPYEAFAAGLRAGKYVVSQSTRVNKF